MAPGKSGSAGGGGKKPPNKRSKMEIPNSLKPDSSQEDSLHSNQPGYVSSATRVQTDHLKSPVCKEYPRKEVYQCDEGHIICNECIAKVPRCPVCRVIYPNKKIRSRIAETELDEMTYNCNFRDHGCWVTNIPRNRRNAHEIQCSHNPSSTGIKFCHLFNDRGACHFRICSNSIMQDPQHTKEVIEHLTVTRNLPHQKVKIGEKVEIRLPVIVIPNQPLFQTVKLFEVFSDAMRKTIGYYVLIRRVSMRKDLSWAVVGLNSTSVSFNRGSTQGGKIVVKFHIEAKIRTDKEAKDGNECIPDLSWTTKSTYLKEWKEFMMIPIERRPPFTFSIPEVFLSDHYKEQDGQIEMSLSFGAVVD